MSKIGYHCGYCGARVSVPDNLSKETKREAGALAHGNTPIQAMLRLRESVGLNLADAKAISLHLTKQPGRCQRCGQPLAVTEGLCAECGALNLDW